MIISRRRLAENSKEVKNENESENKGRECLGVRNDFAHEMCKLIPEHENEQNMKCAKSVSSSLPLLCRS